MNRCLVRKTPLNQCSQLEEYIPEQMREGKKSSFVNMDLRQASSSKKQFFEKTLAMIPDFAFHVYPSRANTKYLVQIDLNHYYSLIVNDSDEIQITPDFSHYRQEALNYDETALQSEIN